MTNPDPTVPAVQRTRVALNEDWAATIVGLLLLGSCSPACCPAGWCRDGQHRPAERRPAPAAPLGAGRRRRRPRARRPHPLAGADRAGRDQGHRVRRIAAAIEYPVYAIVLGLLGNVVLTRLGLRDRLAGGFRTEFFIKTGLVLLGASINLAVIVSAAGPAILQAVVLISVVFGFTWWLGGRLGLDDKLRALLSSAVSICGVSAAIAAAGAVQAKKEQLAYTASMVDHLRAAVDLPAAGARRRARAGPAVAGAWVGGNIDTTAAVTAAGAIVGEQALQIATIVKTTQNALLGVVAVALTAYFAFAGGARPRTRPGRGPASCGSGSRSSCSASSPPRSSPRLWTGAVGAAAAKPVIGTVNDLRTLFLILAFVSIGLEFRVAPLREAGWRPVGRVRRARQR